jgi:hypothetical protein
MVAIAAQRLAAFPARCIFTGLILCHLVGFVDETRKVEREFTKDEARRRGSLEEYTNSPETVSPFGGELAPEKNRSGEGDTTLTDGPCPADQEEPLNHSHVSLSAVTVTWTVAANRPDPAGILDLESRTESSPGASSITALGSEHQQTTGQGPHPASHFPQASDQTLQHRPVTRLDCRDDSQGPRSSTSSWPLDAPQEAHLLRHFIDNVSCFVRFPHRLPDLSSLGLSLFSDIQNSSISVIRSGISHSSCRSVLGAIARWQLLYSLFLPDT